GIPVSDSFKEYYRDLHRDYSTLDKDKHLLTNEVWRSTYARFGQMAERFFDLAEKMICPQDKADVGSQVRYDSQRRYDTSYPEASRHQASQSFIKRDQR